MNPNSLITELLATVQGGLDDIVLLFLMLLFYVLTTLLQKRGSEEGEGREGRTPQPRRTPLEQWQEELRRLFEEASAGEEEPTAAPPQVQPEQLTAEQKPAQQHIFGPTAPPGPSGRYPLTPEAASSAPAPSAVLTEAEAQRLRQRALSAQDRAARLSQAVEARIQELIRALSSIDERRRRFAYALIGEVEYITPSGAHPAVRQAAKELLTARGAIKGVIDMELLASPRAYQEHGSIWW